jgi:CheY-like chemotaxis protein
MNILFVDDDTDDKDIFFEAINAINPEIECDSATNGEEALKMLEANPNLPQFIFLDINMPVMDGKSFLQAIRSHDRLKHIQVVIYSTTEDKEEIRSLSSLGADYIGKPTSFEILKQSLTKYFLKPGHSSGIH